MKNNLCAIGILVLLSSLTANADERKSFDLNFFGLSYHNSKNRSSLNEENWGVGVRYNFDRNVGFGFMPFVEANLIKNSQKGQAFVFAGGIKKDNIVSLGRFDFGAAIAVARISYKNPKINATITTTEPIAFLSATYDKKWSLNAIPLPENKAWLFSLTYKHLW